MKCDKFLKQTTVNALQRFSLALLILASALAGCERKENGANSNILPAPSASAASR
jgi:hypothetical protein